MCILGKMGYFSYPSPYVGMYPNYPKLNNLLIYELWVTLVTNSSVHSTTGKSRRNERVSKNDKSEKLKKIQVGKLNIVQWGEKELMAIHLGILTIFRRQPFPADIQTLENCNFKYTIWQIL